jgi:hypothetical protein
VGLFGTETEGLHVKGRPFKSKKRTKVDGDRDERAKQSFEVEGVFVLGTTAMRV